MKFLSLRTAGAVLILVFLGSLSGCVTIEKRDLSKVGRSAKELVFPQPPDEPRFVFERTFRGSADVIPETDEGALRRALTGEGSIRNEPLVKPYAVAVYRGRVIVSDSAARAVRVFDVPGNRYYRIGEDSIEGAIAKPLGLDVDGNGTVFVADATKNMIQVYDIEGKYLRTIGGPSFFKRLSSVTVSLDGARLYVVDIGGVDSDQHRVRVFDARTGKHLSDIGKRGSGPGEFNLPRDVAVGKDGRIYVVDGGNFRVQMFDKDGRFLKAFGQVGKGLGDFARPKEIALDSVGNVYVADSAFGNFQIFSPDGALLMFIGERSERDIPAGYMLPSGIAVDEDDRVYFVDQWFSRIDVFRPYRLKSTDGYLGQTVRAK